MLLSIPFKMTFVSLLKREFLYRIRNCKYTVFIIFMLMSSCCPVYADSAEAEQAKQFVQTFCDEIKKILNIDNIKEQIQQLKNLFKTKSSNYENLPIDMIGKDYWEKMSDKERKRYVDALETHVFTTLLYTIMKGKFSDFKIKDDNGNIHPLIVNGIIKRYGGELPHKLEWTLRKDGRDFKIDDIKDTSISSLKYNRENQIASVLKRNNYDITKLIDTIEKRSDKLLDDIAKEQRRNQNSVTH